MLNQLRRFDLPARFALRRSFPFVDVDDAAIGQNVPCKDKILVTVVIHVGKENGAAPGRLDGKVDRNILERCAEILEEPVGSEPCLRNTGEAQAALPPAPRIQRLSFISPLQV